jgi:pimeloyl-ACP methyl ester carboxylesterase
MMAAESGRDDLMVTTADGRDLHVRLAGPAGGMPLVFHHGAPGAIANYRPMTAAAASRGLRLVRYARPGYGASTPQPGRCVADAAGDVAAILDHIGADRFVTAGWSGGGPHALACAVVLAGRCQAAASIAGVAPHDAAGLSWMAGMAEDNVTEFSAAQAGEAALAEALAEATSFLRTVTADQLPEAIGDLASATDLAVLTGEFAEFLAASFRAATSSGVAGWRDDDLAYVRDWGFALPGTGAKAAPIAIWQGSEDNMVPLAHGEWLAANLPGARPHMITGAGHLTLMARWFPTILDDLLELPAGR